MPVKSALQFVGYDVTKLQFEKNSLFVGDGEVQITPKFKKEVSILDENSISVSLGVLIENTDSNSMPFNLCVELTGHFKAKFSGEESQPFREQLINQNTIAILFPFLRSTVASLTLAANISPVILPIINLAGAFEKPNGETEE